MSLAKVLETDFRLLHHMCHISNDFVEGIRAKLIEKDNNACWKPATVEEVLCVGPRPPPPQRNRKYRHLTAAGCKAL